MNEKAVYSIILISANIGHYIYHEMVNIYCLAYRSLLLLGLVPGTQSKSKFIFVEQGGFIAVTILQLAASYVLYLALHHESQFRSSGTCMYM